MSDPDGDPGPRDGTPDSILGITTPDDSPPPADTPTLSRKTPRKKEEKAPVGLKAPFRPKPAIPQALIEDRRKVAGFCFKNLAAMEDETSFALWPVDTKDLTIPCTDEQQRLVVQQIVDAFLDMESAHDTKNNAYRKRLTPGSNVYYMDWTIEARAWGIVGVVKSIHTKGFTVPIYDKNIVSSIMQTMHWTFQDRIDWICVVLRTSKYVATCLMKNEKTWTIVGAPHRLYNSTLVNTVSNAHRGVWVKNGREADADHQQRQVKRLKTNSGAPNTATTTNMDMATAVMSSTAADAVVSAPDTSQANARMHLLPGPQRKVRKSKYTSDSPVAVADPTNYNGAVPSFSHIDHNTTAGQNSLQGSSLVAAPRSHGSSVPLPHRQAYNADMVAMLYSKLSEPRGSDDIMAGMTSAGFVVDEATVVPSTEDVSKGKSNYNHRTLKITPPVNRADSDKSAVTKKQATTEHAGRKFTTNGDANLESKSNYQDHSGPSQDKLQAFVENHKGPINWHSKRLNQKLPKPTSANPFIESDTELSDAPSDITNSDVAVRKIDQPVPGKKIENSEPHVRDVAELDAANMLAGLYNSR